VEGPATLSVAAINCTNYTNPAVGNWLAVSFAGSGTYTPICTAQTATGANGTAVGTVTAPATYTVIGDDSSSTTSTTTTNGQQIALDFLAKAFSNRTAANGIPTGLYTATVYVWSTRAKNSVPGYCLGASMPTSPGGIDPSPLCGAPSSTGGATDAYPNPAVSVTGQQMFNVTLYVFDTTQIVQITPNSCPTGGFVSATPMTQFVTVANSENLFTGNLGYGPDYPQFGPNGDGLVIFSLLPFQTTGQPITIPCSSNNSASCVPPLTGANYPVPLPTNVTVNAQTLLQYNSCQVPTGVFNNGTPSVITGAGPIPGIGSLQVTGPVSQTIFVPAPNGTNSSVTVYACRPTIAPAWLATMTAAELPYMVGAIAANTNSAGLVYPGNTLSFPGAPEEYANGNGPFGGNPVVAVASTNPAVGLANGGLGGGPVPSTAVQTCPLTNIGSGGTSATSRAGIFRTTNNYFIEDTNGDQTIDAGDTIIAGTFLPPGGILSTDKAVAGDWTGNTHYKIGIYRPTTGVWYLDGNNDGVWDAGDPGYPNGLQFGGVAGDIPVVGDWGATGKECIGVFRQGFFWVLDYNCSGAFEGVGAGQDVAFPFGGLAGDVPVVGNFFGPASGHGWTVGVVRVYAPGGVPQGPPFFWVLDSAAVNSSPAATNHVASLTGETAPFPYGGIAGDQFVTGDWESTGTWHAGVYRSGSWILDLGLGAAGVHTYDTFFQYGGVAGDQPLVGKW